MPEGPTDPAARTRRGRRTPEMEAELAAAEAARLAAEQEMEMDDGLMDDAGQQGPDDMPVLYPGDIMMAKSSLELEVAGKEAWFTFGAQTRVRPGESEEDAFMRLGAVVNTRVLDLAETAEEQVYETIRRQEEEARRRPIAPRRNH